MRVYSRYNGIKQVFKGNGSPDVRTENKPTTQLLGDAEAGLTLREGGAWNEVDFGPGSKSSALPQREGQRLGTSHKGASGTWLSTTPSSKGRKVLSFPLPWAEQKWKRVTYP